MHHSTHTTPPRQATRQFAAYVSPSLDDEHGHAMLRLSMGRLFDLMLDNMHAAAGVAGSAGAGASGESSPAVANGGGGEGGAGALPKLHLYSGHDSTLLPLLLGEGVPAGRGAPPAASSAR